MNRKYCPCSCRAAALIVCVGLAAAASQARQDAGVAGFAGAAEPAGKGSAAPLSKELGVNIAGVPSLALPALPEAALLTLAEQDELAAGPLRVSVGRGVDFDWRLGRSFPTPDGGTLWVLDVTLEGAEAVRPQLAMNLPEGGKATVYAPSQPEHAPWPYEGRGPRDEGVFWARTAFGATARIEVYLPAGVVADANDPPVRVVGTQHMYRDPDTGLVTGVMSPELLPCHLDFTCHPTYASMGRGVARMFFVEGGSGFVCSGQLMNAINNDRTPYFLTANHCLSTQAVASTLETYWLYQTATCGGAAPNIANAPRADDATLLSTGTASDYTFLMIEGTIRRDLFWQGWTTAMPGFNEQVFGVHHPGGSWKRISFGANTGLSPFLTPPCGSLSNHLRINWAQGTGEGGSSGSGVYRTLAPGDFRLVGQSHCSRLPRTCPGQSPESDKGYGRFDTTYPNIQSLLQGGSDDGFENNDNCASARDLGGVQNATTGGLIVKSTDEDWYSVLVPAGGSATMITNFTHAYGDVDIAIYSSCGGAIVDSSTGTGNSERVDVTNTSAFAARYYLRVYLFNDTRNSYSLQRIVSNPGVPSNNACSDARALTLGVQAAGTTFGATADGSATCGSSNSTGDVWYTFSSICAGPVTLDTLGSSYDTVLSVHAGCPGTTGNQVVCNDDFASPQRWSRVTFNAAANTTYRVRVSGFSGATGNFVLNSSRPGIANDNCANAIAIGNGVSNFTTCGASTDGQPDDECTAFGFNQIDNDVWFRYTATCSGRAVISTAGSNFDTKIAAYPGSPACPPANTAIACNDDFGGTLQSEIRFDALAGTTYRIRVGGYRNRAGDVRLSIACSRSDCPGEGPNACGPGDWNEDGGVDFNDFLAFLNDFNANTACADLDGDGGWDFNDLLAFLNRFNQGC
jgi:hypothetical protein